MDGAAFRQAMRSFAGTVSIVATGPSGRRAGITATSVCSLSDDPPSLLVCVNRNASAYEKIRSAGYFSINVLAPHQCNIAEGFAGRTGLRGDDRFSLGCWSTGMTGAPILQDAAISFDCRLLWERDCDTHSIFGGLVQDVTIGEGTSPLLYLHGRFAAACPNEAGRWIAA